MFAGEAHTASVKTIGRVATVLQALADGAAAGMRLSEVSAAVNLGKATVHRLMGALVEVGYVEYSETSRLYRLGYALFALGAAARRFHIVDQARPALRRLAAATGDTIFLSVRDGDEALCVDRCTGSFPIRTLTLDVGDRRPLGIGAGSLALLAFQPDADVARVLASGAAARRDFAGFGDAELAGMITESRRTGFSLNDGRIVSAMMAVAVPVRDGKGRVLAAMSIAAIRERMEGPRLSELVAALEREADDLGRLMSHPRETPAEKVPELQT